MMRTSPSEGDEVVGDFGNMFVLVMEITKQVKAMGLLTYGNSSSPDSPTIVTN